MATEKSIMSRINTLSDDQQLHLKSILDSRYEILQKQEAIQASKIMKAATDGNNNEQQEFSVWDDSANVEQELSDRHNNEIHAITHAKQRMLDDIFGICSDCQTTIDFPRLLAYPTALRCMSCQERYELVNQPPKKGVKHME
jgi:DnaK suppressor protein